MLSIHDALHLLKSEKPTNQTSGWPFKQEVDLLSIHKRSWPAEVRNTHQSARSHLFDALEMDNLRRYIPPALDLLKSEPPPVKPVHL